MSVIGSFVPRAALAALVFAALALAPRTAAAFETGFEFDADPVAGVGGGNIAFTGAPRWISHGCEVCHVGATHQIGVNLLADQPALFTDGWAPNKQYHLRVEITNEHAGVQFNGNSNKGCGDTSASSYLACNNNGFALEFDDASGKPVGTFAPFDGATCATSGPQTYTFKDGSAIMHAGTAGTAKWDFCWTTPGAGAGTITAYVAAVDGNGGNGAATFPADTFNDDVAVGAVPLFEAALGTPSQNGGCDATGADAGAGAIAIALAGLVAMRRRARTRTAALAAIATLSLAGCEHVRPHQREVLARKNMTFGPDPAEDELDLHMQESREGSSGGYGSSGGGCGCN